MSTQGRQVMVACLCFGLIAAVPAEPPGDLLSQGLALQVASCLRQLTDLSFTLRVFESRSRPLNIWIPPVEKARAPLSMAAGGKLAIRAYQNGELQVGIICDGHKVTEFTERLWTRYPATDPDAGQNVKLN